MEGPRILIPSMARRGSGLWLPTDVVRPEAPTGLTAVLAPIVPEDPFLVAAPAPSDLDLTFVAPDLEVLGRQPLALGQIVELVGTLPFAPAAAALSAIMGAVWHVGHDQKAHLRLAEQLYDGRPILERLRTFVREDPHHVIFNEQHLCALLRLLVVHAGPGDEPDGLSDKHADAFLLALLGVAGLTEHGAPDDPEDQASWAPWLLRAGLYFDRSNLGSDQARAQTLLRRVRRERGPCGHQLVRPRLLDVRRGGRAGRAAALRVRHGALHQGPRGGRRSDGTPRRSGSRRSPPRSGAARSRRPPDRGQQRHAGRVPRDHYVRARRRSTTYCGIARRSSSARSFASTTGA